jgi:hypothetical protein
VGVHAVCRDPPVLASREREAEVTESHAIQYSGDGQEAGLGDCVRRAPCRSSWCSLGEAAARDWVAFREGMT